MDCNTHRVNRPHCTTFAYKNSTTSMEMHTSLSHLQFSHQSSTHTQHRKYCRPLETTPLIGAHHVHPIPRRILDPHRQRQPRLGTSGQGRPCTTRPECLRQECNLLGMPWPIFARIRMLCEGVSPRRMVQFAPSGFLLRGPRLCQAYERFRGSLQCCQGGR